eukprot:1107733-Prymnesium_polylepis.2
MSQHMGAHLLEDDWAKYKKTKPAIPCMLCGVRSSIGQHMNDPSSITDCTVCVVKGSTSKILKPQHQVREEREGLRGEG